MRWSEPEDTHYRTLGSLGFPYNASTELSASEGEHVERIIAHGPPQWVRDLLATDDGQQGATEPPKVA